MEACRRLAITPPQVLLETLHLEAWGGPTAGHLGMEHLKLLLQDPRQRQNHQLPLATAGTLDVPKDETGALGCPRFSLPSPKFPRHSQCWVFKLNWATFASFLHRTTCTFFMRSTVNRANINGDLRNALAGWICCWFISLQSLHSQSHCRWPVQCYPPTNIPFLPYCVFFPP